MRVYVVVSDNYEETTPEKVRGVFTTRERAKEYLSYLRNDHIYAIIIESDIDRFFDVDNKMFYWYGVLKEALNPSSRQLYVDRLSEQYLMVNGVPELNSVFYNEEQKQCSVYISELKKANAEVRAQRILMDAAETFDVPVQLEFNFSFSGKLLG